MFFTNWQDYTKASIFSTNPNQTELAELSKPTRDFLYASINAFDNSEQLKTMLNAQAYYRNVSDIKDKKRYYIDRMGIRKEAVNLSNSTLAQPYIRKMTRQKVNYLLAKEFSIKAEDEKFVEELAKYLDKTFKKMLKNIGTHAIINGIAWIQVYYDETGSLKFKRIPSDEIKPFWADIDHTELDGIIRRYKVLRYNPDGGTEEITKVEYHTSLGVWYFVEGPKGLIEDPQKPISSGHFTVTTNSTDEEGQVITDENNQPVVDNVEAHWDRVPFIAFKYNEDELSLLQLVKSKVDDYDKTASDTSDVIHDIPNAIKWVKGFDGTDKEEFTTNLNLFRTAFLSEGGEMGTVETKADITTIDSHMNRLRRDIYEAGNAVDTQEVSLGNASGVALKFRYADLDIDTDDMASEFSVALEQLVWFIKTDMVMKGIGDYMDEEFEVVFNKDGIVNESEVITDAKNSVGIVSDETIIANHPWVTDALEEAKKVEKEREKAMEDNQDMMMNQSFGTPPTKPAANTEKKKEEKKPATKTGGEE